MSDKTLTTSTIAAFLGDTHRKGFEHECNLIPIGQNTWEQVLHCIEISFLLVDSEYIRQNSNNANNHSPVQQLLYNTIDLCRSFEIPTVFWDNSYPHSLASDLNLLKRFDYIFTIYPEKVSTIKEECKKQNVYHLSFAVNPGVCNPIDRNISRFGKVAFEGTLSDYLKNVPYSLKTLISFVNGTGVHIYNVVGTSSENPANYPEEFETSVKGDIPCELLPALYKKYDIFLYDGFSNISQTVVPQKIYDMLACGANIVSTYSPPIEVEFKHIIKLVHTKEDMDAWLNFLTLDDHLRGSLSLLGLRKIMQKHTYKNRLDSILKAMALSPAGEEYSGVSIIVSTNRPDCMDNIFSSYERQSYPVKELIVVLNNNHMNIDNWNEKARHYNNVKVLQIDECKSLGECLNFAVSHTHFDYISKFDDDDYYSPEYLGDLMDAFKYTNADIVGKQSAYIYFEASKTLALTSKGMEHVYTNHLRGGTITFRKEVFNKVQFPLISLGEDVLFLENCMDKGMKIYSIDKYNYVYVRHAAKLVNTWKLSDEEMMEKFCTPVTKTDDYVPYITV